MYKNSNYYNNTLLLIEDCEDDINIFTYTLKKLNFDIPLCVFKDAESGIKFLEESPDNLPHLIIFDLNMPGINGEDFLIWARSQKYLNTTPMVAFSSSPNPQQIKNCYEIGANSYIVKPTDYNEYTEIISSLINYWYKIVRF